MYSFAQTNIELIKKTENLLILNLSQILRWYRSDFYMCRNGLVGMIYYLLKASDEDEKAAIIMEYFDEVQKLDLKKDANGLTIWEKKVPSKLLKLKKGKKFKIQWAKYDWGTNSKE